MFQSVIYLSITRGTKSNVQDGKKFWSIMTNYTIISCNQVYVLFTASGRRAQLQATIYMRIFTSPVARNVKEIFLFIYLIWPIEKISLRNIEIWKRKKFNISLILCATWGSLLQVHTVPVYKDRNILITSRASPRSSRRILIARDLNVYFFHPPPRAVSHTRKQFGRSYGFNKSYF